jgi:catechol 2,3-dioxygenase-like lactoylglutathione lyase family enzyme
VKRTLAPGGQRVPLQLSAPIGHIHHLRLTVTDLARSRAFYTGVLGFQVAVESPAPGEPGYDAMYPVLWGGIVMSAGNLLLGLRPVAPGADHFDENRVGLDHLSFSLASRADLEQAARVFDQQGVPHGEITRLEGFGIDILPFRDPDNVQLEFTAPISM